MNQKIIIYHWKQAPLQDLIPQGHANLITFLALVKTMTQSKTSKKINQPGLEPDSKGFIKRQLGIKNLPPTKKELDPVQIEQDALLKVRGLQDEIKVRLDLIDDIKTEILQPSLMSQWEEYEDTEEKAIIRSDTTTTKAYLQITNKYNYSETCNKKQERINNLKADLKAAQEKEVRLGKAVFVKQTVSVVVRSSWLDDWTVTAWKRLT